MALPPAIQTFGIQAGDFLAGIDEMLDRVDQLTESLDAAAEAAERIGGAADGSGAALDRFAESEEAADDRAQLLVEAIDRLGAQLDSIDAAIDSNTASIDAMAAAYDDAAGSAAAAGDASVGAGEKAAGSATMLKTAFLGVALALGFGVDQAAKYQSASTKLLTQAGVAKSQFAGLQSGVLSLASQVGQSPTSLMQALYHVESSFQSLGISGPKALSLLKIAAEGAQTGGANLVDVTNALDATIASGVSGVTSYSAAMGALNAIVGAGDMTMQDLADAMGTGLMAQGKLYGQSITQIGAALATLGDNNIRGAKAATDLRMTWQALQQPLATSKGLLASLGLGYLTLASTMEHHGLTAALSQFTDHLKASRVPLDDWGQDITAIFGKRAGTGIGVLVDQLDRLKSKLPDIKKGADDFGNAWKTQTKTLSQQWDNLKSGTDALAISFGTVLLPAVTVAVGWLAKFAGFLEKHGEIAAFAGALLALAAGFKIAAAMEKLFGEDSMLTDPVFLVIAGVIALAAGLYELYKHFKVVRDIVADAGHVLAGVWDAAVGAAKTAVHWFASAFDSVVRGVKELPGRISSAWDSVTGGAAKAGHAASHAFASGWDDVYRDTVGEVVRAFEGVKGAITGGFDGWWKAHGRAVEEVWRAVWQTVTAIFTTLWDDFMDVAVPAFDMVSDALQAAWAVVSTVTKAAWDAVAAYVKTAWDVAVAAVRIGVDAVTAYVKTGWDLAVAIFRVALDTITMVMKTGWDIVVAVVRIAVAGVELVLKTAWDIIVGIFSIALDLLTGHWAQAWTDLQAMCVQVWNNIRGYLEAVWKAISTVAVQVWNNIREFIAGVWTAVRTVAVQVWNNIRGFLEQAWNTIVTVAIQAFNNLKAFLAQTWHDIYNGVVTAWHAVNTFFSGVPGKILAALGDLSSLLYAAGQAVIHGLIRGIESMASLAWGAVKSVGSGLKSAFMSAIHALSPSKDFYQYGAWITQGLANGITETMGQAIAKARQLAVEVKAGYLAGQITATEETQLLDQITSAIKSRQDKLVKTMTEIGLKMRAGLLSSLEGAGTAAKAKSAVGKMITMVQEAWSAGAISTSKASAMTAWLETDNDRLQKLAAQRQQLTATVKAADAYASTTATNTEQWAGLSNVTSAMTSGGMVYSGNILAGMQADLTQIRQFGVAIKKLAKLGLRKDLLNQIIQMGPAQGLQVAEALIDGPGKVIAEMDRTQAAIVSGSQGLGQTAANLEYDTGKAAGKGFLSGLQAQEKEVTKMMDRLAKSMVATMRRELGLGEGGGKGGGDTYNINVHGFIGSESQLALELYKLVQQESLRHSKRNGGNNGLNL